MKNKLQKFMDNILKFYADLLVHGFYHHGCYHL